MNTIKRLAIVVAVGVTLASVLVPGVAHAAPSPAHRCSLNGAYIWLPYWCDTDSVRPNEQEHWIDVGVYPYPGCDLDYKVRDVANGVVIHSGRASEWYSTTLWGVHSIYRLELSKVGSGSGCGGEGELESKFPYIKGPTSDPPKAAQGNWFGCDEGEVCFYTGSDGTGKKCSFGYADQYWADCSWRDTDTVKSVWNRGSAPSYTGVVYFKKTEYRDRAGCTKQGKRGNLAGGYQVHSHRWTFGHCGG